MASPSTPLSREMLAPFLADPLFLPFVRQERPGATEDDINAVEAFVAMNKVHAARAEILSQKGKSTEDGADASAVDIRTQAPGTALVLGQPAMDVEQDPAINTEQNPALESEQTPAEGLEQPPVDASVSGSPSQTPQQPIVIPGISNVLEYGPPNPSLSSFDTADFNALMQTPDSAKTATSVATSSLMQLQNLITAVAHIPIPKQQPAPSDTSSMQALYGDLALGTQVPFHNPSDTEEADHDLSDAIDQYTEASETESDSLVAEMIVDRKKPHPTKKARKSAPKPPRPQSEAAAAAGLSRPPAVPGTRRSARLASTSNPARPKHRNAPITIDLVTDHDASRDHHSPPAKQARTSASGSKTSSSDSLPQASAKGKGKGKVLSSSAAKLKALMPEEDSSDSEMDTQKSFSHRFWSKGCADYGRVVAEKKISMDRAVDWENFAEKGMDRFFKKMRLSKAVSYAGPYCETIVRDFYANLRPSFGIEGSRGFGKVFIRDALYEFTPEAINTFLGRSNIDYPPVLTPSPAEAARRVTGVSTSSAAAPICSKLTAFYYALFTIVRFNWLPTGNVHSVHSQALSIIYNLGAGNQIDIGRVIFSTFANRIRDMDIIRPLPLPSLIWEMLKNQGFNPHPTADELTGDIQRYRFHERSPSDVPWIDFHTPNISGSAPQSPALDSESGLPQALLADVHRLSTSLAQTLAQSIASSLTPILIDNMKFLLEKYSSQKGGGSERAEQPGNVTGGVDEDAGKEDEEDVDIEVEEAEEEGDGMP